MSVFDTGRIGCSNCGKHLEVRELESHAVACAHARIAKLEERLAALSRAFNTLADQLMDAGVIPENRP